MNRLTLLLCFMIPLYLCANRSEVLSTEKMQEISSFIADGQIIDSRVIETERFDHPDGSLFENRHYESRFKIRKIIKSELPTNQPVGTGRSLTLRYWHTDDHRYRGDMGPLLQAGDQFRLFCSTFSEQDGELIGHIVSENNVRPEVYDFEETGVITAIPYPEASGVIEEVTEPEPAIEEPAEVVVAAPIEEEVEPASNWWLWLVGAVVVVGGVLLVRRESL